MTPAKHFRLHESGKSYGLAFVFPETAYILTASTGFSRSFSKKLMYICNESDPLGVKFTV